MTPRFHTLRIKDIRKETEDCVSISFDIPAHLQNKDKININNSFGSKVLSLASESINKDRIKKEFGKCKAKYVNLIESIEHLKIVFKEESCLKFQKIVKPIFDQMIQNKKQNQELAKFRDWLLPMLMNGQARVK